MVLKSVCELHHVSLSVRPHVLEQLPLDRFLGKFVILDFCENLLAKSKCG